MISHSIVTYANDDASEAAIEAVREAIKQYSKNAQALHIIIATVLFRQNRWKAVIRSITVPHADNDNSATITFAHLPQALNDLYETLLPEVDHLNLIEDEDIWKEIEEHLLDIYFYEAVHLINDSDKEDTDSKSPLKIRETQDIEPDVKTLLKETYKDSSIWKRVEAHLFDQGFYDAVHFAEQHFRLEEEEIFLRKMNKEKEIRQKEAAIVNTINKHNEMK